MNEFCHSDCVRLLNFSTIAHSSSKSFQIVVYSAPLALPKLIKSTQVRQCLKSLARHIRPNGTPHFRLDMTPLLHDVVLL